jgi:hypothetical protein
LPVESEFMGQRGRKSKAELTVLPGGRIASRLDPPASLTEEEAEVWVAAVASEPDGFFNGTAVQQILADYCRHTVAANLLSETISKAMKKGGKAEEKVSLRDLQLYLRMRDLETRAIGDKATKLRLTNQSRYRPKEAGSLGGKQPKVFNPWDDPLDD